MDLSSSLSAPSTGTTLSSTDVATSVRSALSHAYALGQRSHHIFASPLGPFYEHSRHHYLPRFVYFGEHTSAESVHLAFHAGFDARDLRGSLVLLQVLEHLAKEPAIGQGLQLSFFPVLDVLGLEGVRPSPLALRRRKGPSPEIALLRRDASQNRHHGFLRVERGPIEDAILIREHGADFLLPPFLIESVPVEGDEPVPVLWERGPVGGGFTETATATSTRPPVELFIGVPGQWSPDRFRTSADAVVRHLLNRFRTLQAYAPGL